MGSLESGLNGQAVVWLVCAFAAGAGFESSAFATVTCAQLVGGLLRQVRLVVADRNSSQ